MFDEILAKFEVRLLRSVDDVEQMKNLKMDLKSICASIEGQVAQGAFSIEELHLLKEQAATIKLLASYFASLEKNRVDLIEKTKTEAQKIFDVGYGVPDVQHSNKMLVDKLEVIQATSMQETLNSKLLRRWFLDNVSDPFPTRKTKEELVMATNALVVAAPPNAKDSTALSNQPIDYSQCTLWLINSRRRSHWTDFFRCYAHSDKDRMRRFIECLQPEMDVEEPGENKGLEELLQCEEGDCCEKDMATRVSECRDTFTQMTDWLRQITKEKVGDWMDDVIREARAELKRAKAVRREERKRVAEVQERRETERLQKRKVDASQETAKEGTHVRRSSRAQKRKEEERKGRRAHRRMPSAMAMHTPSQPPLPTQFNDYSVGSTSWCSSGGSDRVPSLVGSDGQMRVSSSSSSLATSYEAFERRPASPTLNIRKNNRCGGLRSDQGDAALAAFNPASLYTSHYEPMGNLIATPATASKAFHPSPVDMHPEEELSGGARSRSSRSGSHFALKLENLSRDSSSMGWEGLASPSVAKNAVVEQPPMSLWTNCSPSK